jgi:hypothetical protein
VRFKAGDKVRLIGGGEHKGIEGSIAAVNAAYTAPYPYYVKLLFEDGSSKHLAFGEAELEPWSPKGAADNVNSPSHYTWLPNGLEVIDLIEHLMTNRGNAVKYLCRAGLKSPDTELEDLRKAAWYVQREIKRIEKVKGNG